jgi:molybdopterin synthase sulfur carrier subunit
MSPSSSATTGVTVRLSPTLAALGLSAAARHEQVRVAGGTVRQVIDALEAAHPGMRFALCLETGEIRPFVNVFVDGVHMRYRQGLETPTPDGTTIHIFQSVAGG